MYRIPCSLLRRDAVQHLTSALRLMSGLNEDVWRGDSVSDAAAVEDDAAGAEAAADLHTQLFEDVAPVPEAEARRDMSVPLGLPAWLAIRLRLSKVSVCACFRPAVYVSHLSVWLSCSSQALLACGCAGDATAMCEAALREARQGGDMVSGHRLLCVRAEIAAFDGQLSTARSALDIVGDAESGCPDPSTRAHAQVMSVVMAAGTCLVFACSV